MKKLAKAVISMTPLLVISALLYAGLFIKPTPVGGAVRRPTFERGDAYYGIAVSSGTRVWAAGRHGKIIRSEDRGASWSPQASPVKTALQDISAWDESHVVAVGDHGVVAVTQDGGATWREIDVPHSGIANKLIRVETSPGGRAWAVGEGGTVLRSSDYGAHWTRIGADEDVTWNDVAFVGQRGWRVGEFGRIMQSIDGGASWHPQHDPLKVSLMAVAFRDERNGVAVGLGGAVLTTDDGGENWHPAAQVTREHLFDVTWDGNRWIAVGDKGVFVIGHAAGDAWRMIRISAQDRSWHTTIRVHGDHYLVSGATIETIDKSRL